MQDIIFIIDLLNDIGRPLQLPAIIFEDNFPVLQFARNEATGARKCTLSNVNRLCSRASNQWTDRSKESPYKQEQCRSIVETNLWRRFSIQNG